MSIKDDYHRFKHIYHFHILVNYYNVVSVNFTGHSHVLNYSNYYSDTPSEFSIGSQWWRARALWHYDLLANQWPNNHPEHISQPINATRDSAISLNGHIALCQIK